MAEGHRSYIDLVGLFMVTLPMPVGFALLGLVLVFMLAVTVRRRAFGRPLLAMALALVGATALAWLGQYCIGLLRDGDYWRAWPLVASTAAYASAIAAILLALRFVARDAVPARLRSAFWLLFTLLGASLSVLAPGASIFFIGPPLLAALGMIASRWSPAAERIGAVAALLLLYLTFGVALGLLEELLNGGPHWLFAPLGALLLLPALIELGPLLGRVRPVWIWAGAADLVLIGWGAVALMPAYSADRQQQFGVEYVWDADARSGAGRSTMTARRCPMKRAGNGPSWLIRPAALGDAAPPCRSGAGPDHRRPRPAENGRACGCGSPPTGRRR